MARWEVPALALGVSVGGAIETLAVGCDPDTLFHIASITKPFTAVLALDLLDLDAGTGIWPADVRVRHLLSHTSGFDGELADGDQARFGSGDDALDAQAHELASVRRWVGVERIWSYANAGYWLAGWLCSQAAGEPWEDVLRSRVTGPAGLESTSFGPAEVCGTGPDAAAAPYPRARRPSGGLVSNVPDLLRFGERVLNEPRLRTVHGKPVAGVYGLGLGGERVGGIDVWGHAGSWGGFESSLLTMPDRDAVFVGLTNSSLGGKALRELEEEFFERVLGGRRRVPETVELPTTTRGPFAGSYLNSGGSYGVELSASGLRVTFDDGEFAARPIGARVFEITDGARIRERFDFPQAGFGRFASRLAERAA
jgi:CubicO group peptidase (beta-lactamase class C family)